VSNDLKFKIGKWLTRLARMVRHQQQLSDFERGEMVADYTAMLLDDELPGAAFSNSALHAVAEVCEWWPPYRQLAKLIREDWAVQQVRIENAQTLRIAGPTDGNLPPLDGTNEIWWRYWTRNEMTNWTGADETGLPDSVPVGRRKIGLSMLKQFAPFAYQRAVGGRPDEQDPTDWKDRNRLARTLREAKSHPLKAVVLRCIQAAVKKNAPDNLPMVEDEMIAEKVPLKPEGKRREMAQ